MAEMKLTKKGQQRINRLLKALGQDQELQERFARDARGVLDEFGLARLVPAGTDLVVEVEKPFDTARMAATDPPPSHLDLAHIDQSNPFPDPLPPTHLDMAHTDAVFLTSDPRPTTVLKVRGKFRQ
jgi:hypothetical protein